MSDRLLIVALTLGCCLAVGLLGALVLFALRRRSLRLQLTVATLIPVLAVAATVWVNVEMMFLSGHDSSVVLLSLGTSLVLAVLAAWLVVRRVASGYRRVGVGLQQLVVDSFGAHPASDSVDAEPTGGPESRAGNWRTTNRATNKERYADLPAELSRVLDDLQETRRTLATSRDRERAAEQSRRELVNFMSHDLRTPLAGLRALSEGLEDGVITDVPRALGHVRITVARMTVLVDDLFALSRVQGPPDAKVQRLVSLTELITDVVSESAPTARARRVTLDVDLPDDDRLAVVGSPDDLARALGNLVTNAIRHTAAGESVRTVGRRADDGRIEVAVIDACGGITEDNLTRVFDTGWRGVPSRSGDDGAGLGLAIARGVVQSHSGTIGVTNVDGGCRFAVDLPAPRPSGSSS